MQHVYVRHLYIRHLQCDGQAEIVALLRQLVTGQGTIMATAQQALDAVKALGTKVDAKVAALPGEVAAAVTAAQAADSATNDATVAEAQRASAVLDGGSAPADAGGPT